MRGSILSRIDDRVTLVNGEKILPIPYEHQIREHELVQEAVVFGVEQEIPGLRCDRAGEKARGLTRDEISKALAPIIDAANARTEAFGRISPKMVEILEVGMDIPRTDKGTIIRAAILQAVLGPH